MVVELWVEMRQQEIKKDTDKLLELANELKQYVDKTNENIISLDVIKKAEQIEKLAHANSGRQPIYSRAPGPHPARVI